MKFKNLCEKQESPVTGVMAHCLDKDYKNRKIRETIEKRIEKFFQKNITKEFDEISGDYLEDLIKDAKFVGGPISNFSKNTFTDSGDNECKNVTIHLYGVYEDRRDNISMPCEVTIGFGYWNHKYDSFRYI